MSSHGEEVLELWLDVELLGLAWIGLSFGDF
jgi:hypothetical protein